MTIQPRCIGTNKAGEQCRGKALSGGRYCIAHDPERVVDMAEWRRQGGKAKSNTARARKQLPDAVLSPTELQGLLSKAIKDVLAGKIDPGPLNAAANAARAIASLRETGDVEQRLEQLEQALNMERKRRWG
jgi:hypothetical protein